MICFQCAGTESNRQGPFGQLVYSQRGLPMPNRRILMFEYPVGELNPNPAGIRSPSAFPLDGACRAHTSSTKIGSTGAYPALQPGISPSDPTVKRKNPMSLVTPGSDDSWCSRVSQTQRIRAHRVRLRIGEETFASAFIRETQAREQHCFTFPDRTVFADRLA